MTLNKYPLLYSFRRCPYAMRARMAIYIANITVEHVEVSLKNKPQSLLNYSPKGTVPVLVTLNGDVIEQSRDIMMWALHQADPDNWLLQNDARQQDMNELVDLCDLHFKPLLDRYKYFDRYPELPQEAYRTQAEFFLQILEERLGKSDYLISESFCFADVAIFPFIRQFANTDSIWFTKSGYKRLQRWLETCINSTLFSAIIATQ